jgi:DNA invertase Pin-like site-specific DNA recombinase
MKKHAWFRPARIYRVRKRERQERYLQEKAQEGNLLGKLEPLAYTCKNLAPDSERQARSVDVLPSLRDE